MHKSTPTPFDRTANERPLLKLLLHSESLAQRIAASDAVTLKLMELSAFSFLEVLATPTRDESVSALLSQLGVESACVEQREGYWGLYQSHSSTLIGPVQENINYSNSIVPGSAVTWLDFIMARNLDYDYFVVDPTDAFLSSTVAKVTDLGVAEAINRVRLKAVHLNSPLTKASTIFIDLKQSLVLFRLRTALRSLALHWSLPMPGIA